MILQAHVDLGMFWPFCLQILSSCVGLDQSLWLVHSWTFIVSETLESCLGCAFRSLSHWKVQHPSLWRSWELWIRLSLSSETAPCHHASLKGRRWAPKDAAWLPPTRCLLLLLGHSAMKLRLVQSWPPGALANLHAGSLEPTGFLVTKTIFTRLLRLVGCPTLRRVPVVPKFHHFGTDKDHCALGIL